MDQVPTDFKELLECFNARGVEYLVVGGYALAFHGAPRATGDIDLLVRPEPGNASRVLAALADFGFASLGLQPHELAVPDQIVQLGVPPVRVDIITSLSGLSWDEAWGSKQQGTIAAVPVHFRRARSLHRQQARRRTPEGPGRRRGARRRAAADSPPEGAQRRATWPIGNSSRSTCFATTLCKLPLARRSRSFGGCVAKQGFATRIAEIAFTFGLRRVIIGACAA